MDYVDLQGRRETKGKPEDHQARLDYRVDKENKVLVAFRDLPDQLVVEQSIQDGAGQSVHNTSGTELVYKGLAAGSYYSHSGGGANYLCATEEPEYLSSTIPRYSENDIALSYLFGAEYQVPGFSSLHDNNVPCAVCYTAQRSTKLMIPGRLTCPPSWTEEYEGYLMAERSNVVHKHSTVYECVDKDGEAVSGQKNTNGALFHLVGVVCDHGLPCPPYVTNRPTTCVVCTK